MRATVNRSSSIMNTQKIFGQSPAFYWMLRIGSPHQAHAIDIFAHPGHGMAVGKPMPVLIPGLGCSAKPKNKTAAAQLGHGRGGQLGQQRGASKMGHTGSEPHLSRHRGHGSQWDKAIAPQFRRPQTLRAGSFRAGRKLELVWQRHFVAAEQYS